jgi:predicted O-linked N-acetylglucosamine transferase (SPINDLY family)
MDYVLGDPYVTPDAESWHFTEKILRLPETYACFTPPNHILELASLPARLNSYITFGCFNNLNKINDPVIELWSEILHAIPASKLILKTRLLADYTICELIRGKFTSKNITHDRIILEGPAKRYDLLLGYNRIDIALDPFPYPGGTTTAEALWMGVPVLTLRGDRFLSHVGESIAMNTGRPEWIANDKDEYVEKAVYFASDISRLSTIRNSLREKVLLSPLFDAKRFARNFENAMLGMWRSKNS